MTDEELIKNVTNIHADFPKSGYREIKSMLATQTPGLKVQERRVRFSLREILISTQALIVIITVSPPFF